RFDSVPGHHYSKPAGFASGLFCVISVRPRPRRQICPGWSGLYRCRSLSVQRNDLLVISPTCASFAALLQIGSLYVTPPALEVRNLHKRYGDLEVLKGVDLLARDGDVISILGSSGSGKSTLLRCINLLENPHQGQILVAGEELKLKPSRDGSLVAAD